MFSSTLWDLGSWLKYFKRRLCCCILGEKKKTTCGISWHLFLFYRRCSWRVGIVYNMKTNEVQINPAYMEAWPFQENHFLASLSTCLPCFNVNMSLKDCSPQRGHSLSLHSLPLAENYGKRFVRTFLDFRHTDAPETLDAKGFSLFLFNLRGISKVKVVSFLMGLTLMFLVMASYILMWDKKGLSLTASPYHFRPMDVSTTTQASFENSLLDLKMLFNMTSLKQQCTPRKIPDEKDIIDTDPHVSHFSPPLTEGKSSYYQRNLFCLHQPSPKSAQTWENTSVFTRNDHFTKLIKLIMNSFY